ncbi:MAG: HEPN domain-containing protein [Candidatus Njordarchaeia archaeon]
MCASHEFYEKSRVFINEAHGAIERGIYWLACFHAHQAVEFYVKALLEEKTGSYPFTHDLVTLIETLRVLNINITEEILRAAESLTPHYVMSRYGARGILEYNQDRARRCVGNAEVILEWLKSIN